MSGHMSRGQYEEERAEAWLEEQRALAEEDRRLEREESGAFFGDPEDFDPIWEATVHGELDDPEDHDCYDGDEW